MTNTIYNLTWLLQKYDKGETLKFLFFWGHTNKYNETVGKFCFSQWADYAFTVDGITYKTAEHWMMAKKALLFNDTVHFEKIIEARTPAEAKELGRQVIDYEETTWNKHKFEIVVEGNFHKFSQNPLLATYLLQTQERVLVEASPVDAIWGIGMPADHVYSANPHYWRGENLLGFALMEVRDKLL